MVWKAIDFSIKTERLSLAKQRDTPAVHRSFRDLYYIASTKLAARRASETVPIKFYLQTKAT